MFVGGFDLGAAHAVAGGGRTERYQVLDQLTLLVEKSLVVAEEDPHGTRYRLLETVRQYALEKLGEADDSADARDRHRDHYASIAEALDYPADADYERQLRASRIRDRQSPCGIGWCHENAKSDSH